jgi:hypothetical protein
MLVAQGVDSDLATSLVKEDYYDENGPVLLPSNSKTDLTCIETGKKVTVEMRLKTIYLVIV